MKIINVAVSLCVFFAPGAREQEMRSDREQAGLVGPVRVIREYRTFSQRRLNPAALSKLLEKALTKPLPTVKKDNYWRRTTNMARGTRIVMVPMGSG